MKKEFLVGVFFFIGLAALAILSFQIDDEGRIFKHEVKVYHARFDNVGGLKATDPVYLAGLRVGKITAIAIVENRLDVEFSVDSQYELKEDSVATIVTSSLLGGRQLSISLGSPETAVVQPGSLLESRLAPGMDQILESLDIALGSISGTIEETRPEIVASLVNVREITEQIRDAKGLVGRLISDPELAQSFADVVETTREVAAKINSGEGALGRLVSDEKMGEELAASFSSLRETVDNFKGFSDRLIAGEGLIAKLLNDTELPNKLDSVLDDVASAVGSFKDVAGKMSEGEGTIARLINDDELYLTVKDATADLASLAHNLTHGEGTIAKLVNDPLLYDELRRLVLETSQAVEDAREQAPISAFSSVIVSTLAGLQ